MDQKRSRSRNYTEKEKMNLLKLIEKYEKFVENKQTDGTTLQKKAEAWGKIGAEFNASSDSGVRTVQQLKLLYKNIKKHARTFVAEKKRGKFLSQPSSASSRASSVEHEVEHEPSEVNREQIKVLKSQGAADKKELHKTGGGRFVPQLQESGAQILALLGERFEPLKNPHDSSAIYHGDFGVPAASRRHHQHQEIYEIEVVDDPVAGPSWLGDSIADQALYNNEDDSESEPDAQVQISSVHSVSPIPIVDTAGAPNSLLTRPKKLKKKNKAKMPSGEKNIKKEYFATKLRLARFQLHSAKIQHAIDMKIKRLHLKKLLSCLKK